MPKLRVSVNTAKCQSYRRCSALAPGVFAVMDDGKASVLDPEGASRDEVIKAARSCPYRAIIVADDASGEQLFPPVRKPPGQ